MSTRVATELIEELVAAGEHAQALKFALVHKALVRQELEMPAAPEVVGWIHRLRDPRSEQADQRGRSTPPLGLTREPNPARSAAEREQRRLARIELVTGPRHADRLISEVGVSEIPKGRTVCCNATRKRLILAAPAHQTRTALTASPGANGRPLACRLRVPPTCAS